MISASVGGVNSSVSLFFAIVVRFLSLQTYTKKQDKKQNCFNCCTFSNFLSFPPPLFSNFLSFPPYILVISCLFPPLNPLLYLAYRHLLQEFCKDFLYKKRDFYEKKDLQNGQKA